MALSKVLKESIAEVLKSKARIDDSFINELVGHIEESFYNKKGSSPAPIIKESAPAAVVNTAIGPAVVDAKSRMKSILSSGGYSSTGLAIPQPEPVITTKNSAMSSMARILS